MSKHRLTQTMRLVLRNLMDGKPISNGMPQTQQFNHVAANTAAAAMRKRGLTMLKPDATYTITPQGRQALQDHERGIQ